MLQTDDITMTYEQAAALFDKYVRELPNKEARDTAKRLWKLGHDERETVMNSFMPLQKGRIKIKRKALESNIPG